MKGVFKGIATVFYLGATALIVKGLYQMFAYKNTTSAYEDNVNAYVGGDAYNYMINSGRAMVWVILALICAVIATGSLIIGAIDSRREQGENSLRELRTLRIKLEDIEKREKVNT